MSQIKTNSNVHMKTYVKKFWYHKKKCDGVVICEKVNNNQNNNEINIVENVIEVNSTISNTNTKCSETNTLSNNHKSDMDETNSILHQMMEENKELRNMISEQQKQIGEIIPKIGNTTNKFNLNVFLNEQCKDAISLHDFISNLQLCPEDLEDTGKLGYVDGITKIINRGLQKWNLQNVQYTVVI